VARTFPGETHALLKVRCKTKTEFPGSVLLSKPTSGVYDVVDYFWADGDVMLG